MEQFINDIIDYLLPQNDIFLYIFLFVSSIVENLFPPVPGDMITVFGAFLVGTGRLNYLLVFLSTTLGSVIGFMSLVLLGRKINREFFIKKDYRIFPSKSIISAEAWFERYGYAVVFANRFLPGIRSVISLVSGIAKLRLFPVFLLSLGSAGVWNIIWIHTGFLLGNNWQAVRKKAALVFQQYNIAAGILIVLFALCIICYKIYQRRKCRGRDQK